MSRSLDRKWSSDYFTTHYIPVYSSDPAALILLNRQYHSQDHSRFKNRGMSFIRKQWFKHQIKEMGGDGKFKCVICGKQNLYAHTTDKNKLATLDHIIPVSKAPHLWKDRSNFQVACHRCNSRSLKKLP